MRNLPPHFKAVNLPSTHLFTTYLPNLPQQLARQKRSISMCQAFGQHSIRAIIKLIFLYVFLLRLLIQEIFLSLHVQVFPY